MRKLLIMSSFLVGIPLLMCMFTIFPIDLSGDVLRLMEQQDLGKSLANLRIEQAGLHPDPPVAYDC